MSSTEDTAPHLFIVRVWTDPALAPPSIARGLVEHIPSRERRYFRELSDLEGFVAQALAQSGTEPPQGPPPDGG